MELKQNMSKGDRIIRGVVGIWLLAFSVGALLDNRRVIGVTAGIAGLGLVQNFVTGHCGGNALLGIDTSDGRSCSIE